MKKAVEAVTVKLVEKGRVAGLTEALNAAKAYAEDCFVVATRPGAHEIVVKMYGERYTGATHVAQDIQALIEVASASQTEPLPAPLDDK